MDNVQVPRIEAVQNLADHYGSDPYSHSLRVRKRFREQKKLDKAREEADEALKSNYGLPEELALSKEDDESRSKAKEEWKQARQAFEERESSSGASSVPKLSALCLEYRRRISLVGADNRAVMLAAVVPTPPPPVTL